MKNENLPGQTPTGGQPDAGNSSSNAPEQTFTKSQVNEIMRNRINRSHESFFKRYGVNNLNELDDMLGRSKSYDSIKLQFDDLSQKHSNLENEHNNLMSQFKDLNRNYAYKVGNIDESRIADIDAYFKGKGIDINEASLSEELKNHPEWIKKASTVKSLGAEVSPKSEVDERELASRIFGVKL